MSILDTLKADEVDEVPEVDDDGSQEEPDNQDDAPDGEEKPKWDKERQRRDEQRAAQIKAIEESVVRQQQQLARITDLLERKEAKPDEKLKVDEDLEDLIDEDIDYADLVKVVKSLKGDLKNAKQELGKVNDQLAKELERSKLRDETEAQKEARLEIEKLMLEFDKKYGAEYRNDAMKATHKMLKEEGYDEDKNVPPVSAIRLALRLAYKEVTSKPKKRTTGTILDPATGGSGVGDLKKGSLKEVLKDMRQKGKLS